RCTFLRFEVNVLSARYLFHKGGLPPIGALLVHNAEEFEVADLPITRGIEGGAAFIRPDGCCGQAHVTSNSSATTCDGRTSVNGRSGQVRDVMEEMPLLPTLQGSDHVEHFSSKGNYDLQLLIALVTRAPLLRTKTPYGIQTY